MVIFEVQSYSTVRSVVKSWSFSKYSRSKLGRSKLGCSNMCRSNSVVRRPVGESMKTIASYLCNFATVNNFFTTFRMSIYKTFHWIDLRYAELYFFFSAKFKGKAWRYLCFKTDSPRHLCTVEQAIMKGRQVVYHC